jgi:hypothetical protein
MLPIKSFFNNGKRATSPAIIETAVKTSLFFKADIPVYSGLELPEITEET